MAPFFHRLLYTTSFFEESSLIFGFLVSFHDVILRYRTAELKIHSYFLSSTSPRFCLYTISTAAIISSMPPIIYQ